MEVAAEQWAARAQPEEPGAQRRSRGAGRRAGEFELVSDLGRGSKGVVYRAWQPSLDRQVALKCLLPGYAKAEASFTRAIRALGRVEHPHLVKVFTSGSKGAQWFYSVELVEGATLAAICDKLSAPSSAADVDGQTWQEILDTACAEAHRAEKPLSGQRPGGVAGAKRRGAPVERHGASRTQPRPPGQIAQPGDGKVSKTTATTFYSVRLRQGFEKRIALAGRTVKHGKAEGALAGGCMRGKGQHGEAPEGWLQERQRVVGERRRRD